MSTWHKKDYGGLQLAWNQSIANYLAAAFHDKCESLRLIITDDFRDNLVDIKPESPDDKKNLRTIYDAWEQDTWLPSCEKELNNWAKTNPFEAGDETNLYKQNEFIKRNNNYKRYRKIIQVIQNSGIGLGAGRERGHYELSGFMGEPTE